MTVNFQLSGGSVVGAMHIDKKINNQDSYYFLQDHELLVATVCDGCGSLPHAEVGAYIGSRVVTKTIWEQAKRILKNDFPAYDDFIYDRFWRRVRREVLADLLQIAKMLNSDLKREIYRSLLFTCIGAVITSERYVFFHIGDGIFIINGKVIEIGPYPGNAPPYLAYGNLDVQDFDEYARGRVNVGFDVNSFGKTDDLEHFLIGSDGVPQLIQSKDKMHPGLKVQVGPVSQYWENDDYFRENDPKAISRKLASINTERVRVDWAEERIEKLHGLLTDDTTFIVGRRVKAMESESGDGLH